MREAIKASTNWEHGDNLKKKQQFNLCNAIYLILHCL